MANIQPSPDNSKYKFLTTSKNPEFIPGILIPFIPCQEHHKASKNLNDGHEVYDHIFGVVETIPKWLTVLMRPDGITYHTDSFKSRANRQIKAVNRFMDYYEPLYRRRIVSVLVFTFTRINYAAMDMRTMLENVKSRFKSLKWLIRGYIWVLEIEPNEDMKGGFHLHYHLVVAVNRVRIEKLPPQLKMSELWGQRVQVEFVKKSLRGYLSKYLYKSDGKLNKHRAYQISRKLL